MRLTPAPAAVLTGPPQVLVCPQLVCHGPAGEDDAGPDDGEEGHELGRDPPEALQPPGEEVSLGRAGLRCCPHQGSCGIHGLE